MLVIAVDEAWVERLNVQVGYRMRITPDSMEIGEMLSWGERFEVQARR